MQRFLTAASRARFPTLPAAHPPILRTCRVADFAGPHRLSFKSGRKYRINASYRTVIGITGMKKILRIESEKWPPDL